MAIIIPANSAAADTGYSIDNSCRFDGSSSYMTFTLGSETNRDRWTWSCWVKKCTNGETLDIMNIPQDDDNSQFFKFASDALRHDTVVGNATVGRLQTNRLFRDPSAWYHLVIVWDSANATAGNRMRMYVNGVEETSFETDSNPSSGQDSWFYSGKVVNIGRDGRGTGLFDGYMAEIVFCDGQAYAASDFGEFNSDSPTIWQPKDVSGLTFGNNGFWLDFEDSSALGNDVSGNNNDFGVTNLAAVDQATDTPTNNFCTMNPLDNQIQGHTFSEGNNTIATTNASETYNTGTIGVTAGRWYFEVKLDDTTYSIRPTVGVVGAVSTNTGHYLGQQTASYGTSYNSDGNIRQTGLNISYGNTYTAGDIIGVFLDLTSNKIYFSKNGTIQNSGTGISITAVTSTSAGAYFPAGGDRHSDDTIWHFNFGGGAFGGTAVSSAVADANGYGNFEYDPSDGGGSSFDSAAKDFLAICTKNLGSDGG